MAGDIGCVELEYLSGEKDKWVQIWQHLSLGRRYTSICLSLTGIQKSTPPHPPPNLPNSFINLSILRISHTH